MHILYVDESGDDGISPDGIYTNPNSPSKVFVRTGVAVHDWHWRELNQQIVDLRFKYRIPKEVEIHATEIRRGKSRFYAKKVKKETINWFGMTYPDFASRMKIIEDFCTLISTSDKISLICIVINKKDIITPFSLGKTIKNISWEMLIERYNLYLGQQTDKIGVIISDAIQDKIEKEHRDFAKLIYEKSLHVREFHFIESILFEPSDSSNLIQLADIASYAFYRKFNNDDSKYYDIIKNKLLCKDNGCSEGAGLKIWPNSSSI